METGKVYNMGAMGAFFLSEDGQKKPGFPLQVLGLAFAKSLLAHASWAIPRTWSGKPGFFCPSSDKKNVPIL
jgi:hypothetical protein